VLLIKREWDRAVCGEFNYQPAVSQRHDVYFGYFIDNSADPAALRYAHTITLNQQVLYLLGTVLCSTRHFSN
jgi:hypothetical protein